MDDDSEGRPFWQVFSVVCLVALCGWLCLGGAVWVAFHH